MANAGAVFCRAAGAAGCAAILAISLATGAFAQSVISAHSGVIHYVEGDVSLDGTAVHPKFAEFPDMKAGQLVATEEGRAEILLTPGVFLRLAENSSVRMLSNALADTRLEVVSGSVLVEVGELLEHNAISLQTAGARIALAKKGLYRLDAGPAAAGAMAAGSGDASPVDASLINTGRVDRGLGHAGQLPTSVAAKPPSVRVYEGQASITKQAESLIARKGHQVDLDSAKLTDVRFDVKDTDAFYRWSGRRAEYVATANVISARVTSNSEYGSGYTSNRGAWSWNPYFGMFTFLPGNGVYWSPFGSPFYSPAAITAMYIPQRGFSGVSPAQAASAGVSPSPLSSARSAGSAAGPAGGGSFGRSGTSMPSAGPVRGGTTRGH